MMRMSVVLPQPEGPSREKNSPRRTLSEMRAICLTAAVIGVLSGCNGDAELQAQRNEERRAVENEMSDESIFDLFRNQDQPDRQVAVNRYLWQASLDVLSFLPIEGADPFSGLLVTGWGRVAGDGGVYRVTVYISDPALDASALKVAGFRQAGGRAVPVDAAANSALDFDDSALYQAVYRLEEKGLLAAEWGVTENNRRARYYKLTPAGRAHLRAETRNWVQYAGTVTDILTSKDGTVAGGST